MKRNIKHYKTYTYIFSFLHGPKNCGLVGILKKIRNFAPPFSGLPDLVAQLVEQRPFKPWVLGSNPSGITKQQECEY